MDILLKEASRNELIRKSDVEFINQGLTKYFSNNEEMPDLIIVDGGIQQINEAQKFSDTNLVAKSIEQISWKEKMISSSFLYKSFTVIYFINF